MSDKFKIAILCITTSISAGLNGDICHHCEEIRLWNAEHHKNYEYFDDYLEDEDDGSTIKTTAEEPKPEPKGKPVPDRSTPKPAPKL